MSPPQLLWSLPLLGLIAGCILIAGYTLHRLALPKPIPGIPYNKHSANRILGDVPDAMKWQSQRKEILSWVTAQAVKLDSPISQVFMRPFGRPWVILTDFRESQDIMVRRTREFDRSAFFGDLFYNVVPHNQVHMSTGDEWRGHRRLMHDTMSSGFLHDVAGPQIYSTALAMLDLWRQKMRLAAGHPFSAATDVPKGTLDVIWAVTFGSEAGTTKKQFEYLSGVDKIERADEDDKDAAVDFPTVTDPETFTAIITLTGSVEIPMKSPFPRIHHSLAMRFMPRLVAAMKAKDRLITHHLQDSWRKFQGQADEEESAGGGGRVKSAMDLVVQREAIMAQKENRPARYDTPAIRDEMFGFLVAGYDTTSSTICWGLKFLATYQPVQQKLRAELRAAFTRARDAGDKPTVEDIVKSNIPYLDATLEEIHRCGGTASSAIRRTTEDTVILGHRVPKDTDVFMMVNGPGFVDIPLPVDESKRSQSSRDSKDKNGMWHASDISAFEPERWLVKDEKGSSVEFDPRAGPALPFGAGPRGCFGRKLATLELKIIMTLIIWTFELQPTPAALSSFLGQDGVTHEPQQCYLRLAEATR